VITLIYLTICTLFITTYLAGLSVGNRPSFPTGVAGQIGEKDALVQDATSEGAALEIFCQ